MPVTYADVAAQASELNPDERWRLATEILLGHSDPARRSALDYFGINGPISVDVDARIRLGRNE